MRTTITFQEDVARAIEQRRREHGSGISEVVNELVRRGLAHEEGRPRDRFVQRTSPMGARIDVSNVAEVLDTIEAESDR